MPATKYVNPIQSFVSNRLRRRTSSGGSENAVLSLSKLEGAHSKWQSQAGKSWIQSTWPFPFEMEICAKANAVAQHVEVTIHKDWQTALN
jgi:hypothetical protein